MLKNYQIIDKFIESKSLFSVTLGDELFDGYMFDSNLLELLNLMKKRGMWYINELKSELIPKPDRVNDFPSRLSGVFIENVNRNVDQGTLFDEK